MTEQDREGFAVLMLGIGETFGESVSDARMELYFAALSDLDLAELRVAATAHVRTSKFFPRPAELREAIDGSQEDRVEMAWDEMRGLVRRYGYPGTDGHGRAPAFSDEATRRAAMELYGGWLSLCARLPSEGPELLGVAKQFKASYRAYDNVEQRRELPWVTVEEPRELTTDEAQKALTSVVDGLKARGLPTHGY